MNWVVQVGSATLYGPFTNLNSAEIAGKDLAKKFSAMTVSLVPVFDPFDDFCAPLRKGAQENIVIRA